jgi:hypothetical protein
MKKAVLSFALLATGSTLFAQTDVAPPPPPAPPAVENNVTVTITEGGETYTIMLPNLESLGSLADLESLEALEDLENLEDLEGLKTLQYLDDAEEGEVLEFEDFTVTVQADTIDSTAVTIGKWKVIVKEKGDGTDDVDVEFGRIEDTEIEEEIEIYDGVEVFETDWLMFDLGYNTYMNKDFEFNVDDSRYASLENQQTWGSWDVNLHMMRQRVNMFNGYMNLNWGLSFEWHNYRYRGNDYALPQMDTFTLVTSDVVLEKNRFTTTHFTLPIMLGFETNPMDTERSFRIGFGYSPGLLLKGKTKLEDESGVSKVKDNFNLEQPFRHELNVMLGYGNFNVYASYDVNSMFEEGQGPELYPVSIGLILRRGFED